jgi:hypothetical protein
MIRRATKLWIAALGVALAPLTGGAQMSARTIDLASMTVGTAPGDFVFARTGQGPQGQWSVVDDASATQGRAIAQTSTDTTDYRFPLAIYQGVTAKDVDVTLRFKPVAGKVDQAGGIAIRVVSADDYYVVRANALEDNVRFYRVVKGRRQQLAGVNTKVAPGQWHELGLRAEGDRFTISFDGKPALTASDTTFATPGKIALWTKADSVTHFDRITIQPLDR